MESSEIQEQLTWDTNMVVLAASLWWTAVNCIGIGKSLCYLDATYMYMTFILGNDKCRDLPSSHPLIGCDITSSFSWMGKRKACMVNVGCFSWCHTRIAYIGTDANTIWYKVTSTCHRDIHCNDTWPWTPWRQRSMVKHSIYPYNQGYRGYTTNAGSCLSASPPYQAGYAKYPIVAQIQSID